MKIITLIAAYKRRECLEIFSKNLYTDVVCVVSNDDDYLYSESQGWYTVRAENNPLGNKLNIGMQACKFLDPDAIICTGSDDVMSSDTFDYIYYEIQHNDFVGFQDGYFYDLNHQSLYYFQGYNNHHRGKPIGMFRVLRRDLLKKIDYALWDSDRNNKLDGGAWNKIEAMGKSKKILNCVKNNLFICDIKDGNGITSINKIKGKPVNEEFIFQNVRI